MFRKLGVKVAVFVNIILLVIIVGGTVFLVTEQSSSLQNQYIHDGKFMSTIGAKAIGRLLENGIDSGVFTIKEAMDTDYKAIPNMDPPKYHTKYDFYSDKVFLAVQDEFLKNPDFLYAMAMDINGYVPTHNTRYQNPLTGDKEQDIIGNRTKRIFNDTFNLKAAKNEEEGFFQKYERDTGEATWDFASPIYVKGKLWGNFRIGIALNTLEKAKSNLTLKLVTIMICILLLATIAVYFIVNISLQPLREFTQIGSQMADGNVEQEIVTNSQDEIGELAKVLERMRLSLKKAMERLSR